MIFLIHFLMISAMTGFYLLSTFEGFLFVCITSLIFTYGADNRSRKSSRNIA